MDKLNTNDFSKLKFRHPPLPAAWTHGSIGPYEDTLSILNTRRWLQDTNIVSFF